MLVLIEWNIEEKMIELEKYVIDVAKFSLEEEDFTSDVEISVTMVSDSEIHDINKRFRNIDKATDVLSFPMIDFCCDEIVMDKNENGQVLLGDIIISMDTAKKQALEYGHSLEREVGFLTAHSMLHLLGYDHMTEEEEKIMFAKQESILNKVGLKR